MPSKHILKRRTAFDSVLVLIFSATQGRFEMSIILDVNASFCVETSLHNIELNAGQFVHIPIPPIHAASTSYRMIFADVLLHIFLLSKITSYDQQ